MSLADLPPGTDLTKVGSGIPPPGYTQNLIDPVERGYVYTAASCTVLGIAILFVLLRLYIRAFKQRSILWDDSTLVQSAYTGVIVRATQRGVGRHIWDVPLAWMPEFLKLSQVAATTIEPSMLFTKLSLLFLYLRVFSPNKLVRYGIYLGIVYCVVFYLTVMILFIVITDLQSQVRLNYAVAIINVASDFYILGLPLFAISKLQLKRERKIGVMGVFLTGLLACGLSVLGCVYRFNFSYDVTSDATWELIPVFTVNSIEVDVGIMCACMPIFPALFNAQLAGKSWWFSLRTAFGRSKPSALTDSTNSRSNNYVKASRGDDSYVELDDTRSLFKNRIVEQRAYEVKFDSASNGETASNGAWESRNNVNPRHPVDMV